jgi:anti-anti-sigma factor
MKEFATNSMIGEGLLKPVLDERKSRLHVEFLDEVTSTRVPALRRELLAILNSHQRVEWKFLYLDMRNCRMIDSMGLNWLFAELVRLKKSGREMVIRISSPAINRVMEFAGLDKLVTVKFRRRKQTR